jgi:transposase
VFEGMLYVLRTGCQWKAVPKSEYGSSSLIHKYFLEWQAMGLFEQLWRSSLLEYGEREGIAWEWQRLDGAMIKAPLTLEPVGRTPLIAEKKVAKEVC